MFCRFKMLLQSLTWPRVNMFPDLLRADWVEVAVDGHGVKTPHRYSYKRNKQPPITVCTEWMCRRISTCNLCVVPAKHLALGEHLLFCLGVSCSVTTSALWKTTRGERQNKETTTMCYCRGRDVKFFLWVALQIKRDHPPVSTNMFCKFHCN